MAKKEKQIWGICDLFTIPLSDGTFCIGEVVGIEPKALNSAICAFYAYRVNLIEPQDIVELTDNELISVLFVTNDLLNFGKWKVFGKSTKIFPLEKYIDINTLRKKGFIGTKIIGSGNIMKLMNAYYGLREWNSFHNPNYLDTLLVSPNKKPENHSTKAS
jgi:hypothetical protein